MNAAYGMDRIVAALVEIALEFGRLPAESDLKLRRTRDPSFPNVKVFRSLGSKPERLAKIIAYCGDSEQLKNVANWCNEQLAVLPQDASGNVKQAEAIGFV